MKKRKSKRGIYSWQEIAIMLILLASMIAAPLMAYQVTKGDTLWDISGKFLRNPFLWPKVWALNPYISNPHWIYPGNKVMLKAPKPVMPAKKTTETVQAKEKQPQQFVKSKPALPILTHENIHAEGFITKSKIAEIGRVLTNPDDTPMDCAPKTLCFYAKKGGSIRPGDRFTTFTYVKKVKDPFKSYGKIGYLIQLGGDIEVTRVEGRFCFARILRNYEEISEGDPIGSFRKWPDKLVLTPFKKPLKAYIIMMKNGLLIGAQDKVAYIDSGSADGLRPGHELSIYEKCPVKHNPYSWIGVLSPPDRKVGTLVILATQPHTATALIYSNRREIEVGDSVMP